MFARFRFNDWFEGIRCPGCISAYKCGTVQPIPATVIEGHLEKVHGWTRTEVRDWLDTNRPPRVPHRGPSWEGPRLEPPSLEEFLEPAAPMTVCGKCRRRTVGGVCRTCSRRPRLTVSQEADIREWIAGLVHPAKKRFASAYVQAYRVGAALPSGREFGLSERAVQRTLWRLRRFGVRWRPAPLSLSGGSEGRG